MWDGPIGMHFVAGGVGGLLGASMTGPLEMIKTRLQGQRNKEGLASGRFGTRIYSGLKHVFMTSGVRGLWRGIGPHLVSERMDGL